jgi:hypothetical protein
LISQSRGLGDVYKRQRSPNLDQKIRITSNLLIEKNLISWSTNY